MDTLRDHAEAIYTYAIGRSVPDTAVKSVLAGLSFSGGRIVLISVGKAAWSMANAACQALGDRICSGVLITKYGHSRGPIPHLAIFEAGHPVPDENAFPAARAAIDAVAGLRPEDTVLFLLSGGASALFELSDLPLEQLQDINRQLLACGADIGEVNTIRKRLSRVKGGRFAEYCAPARVVSILLSDVLGDRPDRIGSGPTCPDPSTSREALALVRKYGLRLSPQAMALLHRETPKQLPGAECHICGSVGKLCQDAMDAARRLGYETVLLTDSLSCTASEAGRFLAGIARTYARCGRPMAFIAGGETVVKLTGTGRGGRNQELALAAAEGIAGLDNAAVFSVGSDGTDGPTDAAGGYADGHTLALLRQKGYDVCTVLRNNDSYPALRACGGLIFLGPTQTNVNDLSIVLIGRSDHAEKKEAIL